MIKIKNDRTIFFDVDDTLVLSHANGPDIIAFDNGGATLFRTPHKAHIEKLKALKGEGKAIVVWTQGGVDWAEEVVRKLELVDYVDLIVSKPEAYYDDIPAVDFLVRNYENPEA